VRLDDGLAAEDDVLRTLDGGCAYEGGRGRWVLVEAVGRWEMGGGGRKDEPRRET